MTTLTPQLCPLCRAPVRIPGLEPLCFKCGWIGACRKCGKLRAVFNDRGHCATCERLERMKENRKK